MVTHYKPRECDLDLSPKQAEAMEFILTEVSSSGRFPDMREIANHMGFKNAHSADDLCVRLAWKGRIIRRGVNCYTVPEQKIHVEVRSSKFAKK